MMNKLTSQTLRYAGKIGLMTFVLHLILKIATVIYYSNASWPGYAFIWRGMEIASLIILSIPAVWLTYRLYKELFTDDSYKNWALPYKKSQIIRSKALPVIIIVSIIVGLGLMTSYVEGHVNTAIYGLPSGYGSIRMENLLSELNAWLLSLSIPAFFLTLILFSNVVGASINVSKKRPLSLLVIFLGTIVFIIGGAVFNVLSWKVVKTFTQTELLIVATSSLLILAVIIMSIVVNNLADKKLDVA
ncbi:MAG: hypothetical protein J6U23_13030 [Clostridiales bacterium]|nr:hypothetical protein [Clostridiales bacterium]